MMQNTSYLYDELEPNQLRLCRFTGEREHVSAVLDSFCTTKPLPSYQALSYTWALGDLSPTKNWTIKIGEQYLPVLDSLRAFFDTLRLKGALLDGTWWWIDSICINQNSISERHDHVRHMRHIYQNAQKVIVWLAEQSPDSDCAIDFIQYLDKLSRSNSSDADMRQILRHNQYDRDWIALRDFFLRKWWTRVWTVQEFVIPSSISFWCGPRSISRTAVCAALWVSDRCNTTGFKNTIAYDHGWNRRRAWLLHKIAQKPEKELGVSLLALAAYFCSNEASDPRDRLYGLNALSTENHGIDINYSWSVDQVYLKFAQNFIVKHKSLDIICFASLFNTVPGSSLPSWVPDWRKRAQPLVIPLMVSQSSNSLVGNLRPPGTLEYDKLIQYSASSTKAAEFKFEGSALLVRGVIVDAVDGLAGSQKFEFIQSSETPGAQCFDATLSPIGILESVCRCLALDRKDRYLRFTMPLDEFYHDFICLCLLFTSDSTGTIRNKFHQWFQWTRQLQIHGNSFDDILRDCFQGNIDTFLNSTPNQDEYFQDTFYGRFIDIVERRSLRLMTSRNGRLGMAPEKASKGDLICILFGCNVPVVLRRTEHKDQFTIVGECFLDGCMSGEALEQIQYSETTFCII